MLSDSRFYAVLLMVCFTAVTEAAILREDVGELKIHDLLLRPNFLLTEPQQGAFSIGESSFALRWELEKKYSGVMRIGSYSLLNRLGRYNVNSDSDLMLVEAFAEYSDVYGRFRLGRLPVEYGYEGKLWERYLIFPRSLLYSRGVMMLRDVGASYEIEHNRFFTGFVVHNGESDRDEDGRTWYTARWGYRGEKFEIGLNGQTGSTKPDATSLSEDTLAGVDPTLEAKWRIMGLHMYIQNYGMEWLLEVNLGESEQMLKKRPFSAGHFDVGYQWSKTFATHLRYDHFNPDGLKDGDLQQNVSVALVMSNKTRSSNLILVGTKVFEEGQQVSNDELRLIWSLSPSGVVRF